MARPRKINPDGPTIRINVVTHPVVMEHVRAEAEKRGVTAGQVIRERLSEQDSSRAVLVDQIETLRLKLAIAQAEVDGYVKRHDADRRIITELGERMRRLAYGND